jgi:hypothetical protein
MKNVPDCCIKFIQKENQLAEQKGLRGLEFSHIHSNKVQRRIKSSLFSS